jgi:hypothetical protein
MTSPIDVSSILPSDQQRRLSWLRALLMLHEVEEQAAEARQRWLLVSEHDLLEASVNESVMWELLVRDMRRELSRPPDDDP